MGARLGRTACRRFLLVIPLLWSLAAGALRAGPLEDGAAAYGRGDDASALQTFRALALQGNADAQFRLGMMHASGRGVRRDEKEAARWLRLAARQGHVEAQSNLGVMYSRGRGVVQDLVRAAMWLQLAAASGDAVAITNRDVTERRMTPGQIALARQMASQCQRSGFAGCD